MQQQAEQKRRSYECYGFGIVINPRTGEPFLCASGNLKDYSEANSFYIRRFNGSREGSGHFDTYDEGGLCFQPARASNHPRVHVPSGVVRRGQGNGTALYACSAIAAHTSAESANDYGIQYEPDHAGLDPSAVCSAEKLVNEDGDCNRTSSASKWWQSARKHKLARLEKFTEEEPRSIDDCLGPSETKKLLNLFVDDVYDASNVGEASVNVCAQGDYEFIRRLDVDVLPLESVVDANLVIGYTIEPVKFFWEDGLAGIIEAQLEAELGAWEYFNPEAARAVNVAAFREFNNSDRLMSAWLQLCVDNGLEQKELDAMQARYRAGVDVAPEAAMAAQQSAIRKNPSSSRARRLSRRYAKRAPSSGDEQLAAAVLEERARLGWVALADMP